MAKRLASWGLSLLLLLGLWQHQALLDWWRLQNYDAPPAITQLAAETTMTSTAKKFFYLGHPQLDDKPAFASHCARGEGSGSLILGCYAESNIYVLEVVRPELKEVVPVTAAHEMLHAAYERLDPAERGRVNKLIEAYYPKVSTGSLRQQIKSYEQSEPGQLINELHSILATEVSKLSPELEQYYKTYFKDRAQVVADFRHYEGVFSKLKNEVRELTAQVKTLKQQIKSLDAEAEAAIAEANRLSREIDSLRQQGEVAESNQLVPAQNAATRRANELINLRNQLITEHNQLVVRINKLALIQQDLVDSLDASKLVVPSRR